MIWGEVSAHELDGDAAPFDRDIRTMLLARTDLSRMVPVW